MHGVFIGLFKTDDLFYIDATMLLTSIEDTLLLIRSRVEILSLKS